MPGGFCGADGPLRWSGEKNSRFTGFTQICQVKNLISNTINTKKIIQTFIFRHFLESFHSFGFTRWRFTLWLSFVGLHYLFAFIRWSAFVGLHWLLLICFSFIFGHYRSLIGCQVCSRPAVRLSQTKSKREKGSISFSNKSRSYCKGFGRRFHSKVLLDPCGSTPSHFKSLQVISYHLQPDPVRLQSWLGLQLVAFSNWSPIISPIIFGDKVTD